MAENRVLGKRPHGCKDCSYYIKGTCHLNGPQLLVISKEDREAVASLWPPTQPDDWCGQFDLSPFNPE